MKKHDREVMMSSNNIEVGTPLDLFNHLNKQFNFTLDPCASKKYHVCKKYFTKKDNGLEQSWEGHRVFMNPPYGREVGDWIEKANNENYNNGVSVVGLLPARTCTQWFNEIKTNEQCFVRFLTGRLTFRDQKAPAPFPSMLVYWL